MKSKIIFKKMFLLALIIITALSSQAQTQITVTSTKENNYCNGTCTLLNIPELNNNPDAIIFVTPLATVSHPMTAYYIQAKREMAQWSILNLDNTQMQVGTQFSVEYYVRPDTTHFLHVIALKNLRNNGSYIDHAGLNDNPNAQFKFFQNLAPMARGGIGNNYDLKIQYDTVVHRWYMFNTNNRQLSYGDGYNISISSGGNTNAIAVLGKSNIIIDTANPKIITKPTDTIPVIGNAGIVNKVEPKQVPGKTVPTSYDFSNVRLCIDEINNNPLPPRPLVPSTALLPKIKPNGELETISKVTQGLTGITDKMWSPGEVITVGFYNETSALVINKVKQYAKTWETFANIKFDFVPDVGKAEIKVGFAQDGTSWSWMGRDVLSNILGQKTVNFGWFTDATDESEFSSVIIHEFGHVLGFIHEHQAPGSGIQWDKEKVYAFLGAPPNSWSRDKVDQQVFYKYSQSSTNSSAYDKLSIMHYFFPRELTTDGSSFSRNINLSVIDKQFSSYIYPFPPTPVNSTGVLRTGDDCDEIVFSVEYNAVDNGEVEFILEPGIDQNNIPVTWWKEIGIPLIGGLESIMEIQDGSSKTGIIPLSMIDKSRSISFGKAKILGVHTILGFRWPVLPAIIGGCRVRLTWRKDHCT